MNTIQGLWQRSAHLERRLCLGGEIGRRKGLKIPRWVTTVPVRFRPEAPSLLPVKNSLRLKVVQAASGALIPGQLNDADQNGKCNFIDQQAVLASASPWIQAVCLRAPRGVAAESSPISGHATNSPGGDCGKGSGDGGESERHLHSQINHVCFDLKILIEGIACVIALQQQFKTPPVAVAIAASGTDSKLSGESFFHLIVT